VNTASRELLAPRRDVWALVSEPYNLPDWWPAYVGVRPDRLGLAVNARWTVRRADTPGLLRRPGGEGVIVITRVDPTLELAWHDVRQGIDVSLALVNAGEDRTRATVTVTGDWWRLVLEGARSLPKRSLDRLYDLCQTAASLDNAE
jgi:uncharacterized protein YndB with AHSA1/START domain